MKEKRGPWVRLILGICVIVLCLVLIVRMVGMLRRLMVGGVQALEGLFGATSVEETDAPPERSQEKIQEMFGEDTFNGDMVAAPEE